MWPFYKVPILFSFKTGNEVIICENIKGTITCPSGFTVNILSASYGRTSTTVCNHTHMANTSCDSAKDITGILQNHCTSQGGSSCTVTPTNDFFDDDPCVDTYKYLTVKNSCGELNDFSL